MFEYENKYHKKKIKSNFSEQQLKDAYMHFILKISNDVNTRKIHHSAFLEARYIHGRLCGNENCRCQCDWLGRSNKIKDNIK